MIKPHTKSKFIIIKTIVLFKNYLKGRFNLAPNFGVGLKKVLFITLLILLLTPNLALAATFNPNNIIADNDLVDSQTMSTARIQKFLQDKGGSLANYQINDPWGNLKTAAQIIFDASQYYIINPQFLLVTLQKEQSLITDPTPSQDQLDWATGFGVCDSCSKDDPAIQQYKGFFNQVNWTARRNRYYIDTAGQWNFQVGGTYLIDGVSVTMENQATVNLYTYTPHLHGNQVFWTLWTKWFTKKYPDGSLLQVQGQPGVYLIQYGLKRPFFSKAALVSRFDLKKIIFVSKNDLDAYETGLPIKFPNFSLLRSPAGKIYLIDNDQKRYIESPEVFRQIGFNQDEVINVTDQDLASYTDGQTISLKSVYPIGVLLQSKQTGGISYVENGVKHSIMSKEILKSRFPNDKWITVDEASIGQYQIGEPVKFKDGDLVSYRGASSVYVISNGERRPIASKAVFDSLGYQWSNIIWTTERAVLVHEPGEIIDITQ